MKYLTIYKRIRDEINTYLNKSSFTNKDASKYWQEEIKGFSYLFEANELILNEFRSHCHHITGIRHYEYREHHSSQSKRLFKRFNELRSLSSKIPFIPESNHLGGFGFHTKHGLMNIDTLKYYESMIAMEKANLLPSNLRDNVRIIEVGSGWGGFAYTFKKTFPNAKIILVDLPWTFIFSRFYLQTIFPDYKHIFISSINQVKDKMFENSDFVYIPCDLYNEIKPKSDILINMVSFQEMTSSQVQLYLSSLETNVNFIYSHNRDFGKYNKELDSLEALFKEYNFKEIDLLPNDYTEIGKNLSFLQKLSREYNFPKRINKYRHFVLNI